jgi:hypothetical protein
MRLIKNASSLVIITILSLGSIAAVAKTNATVNPYDVKKEGIHALHKTATHHQARMDNNNQEKSKNLASLPRSGKLVGG